MFGTPTESWPVSWVSSCAGFLFFVLFFSFWCPLGGRFECALWLICDQLWITFVFLLVVAFGAFRRCFSFSFVPYVFDTYLLTRLAHRNSQVCQALSPPAKLMQI